jgi:hypothetical protein
MNGNSNSIKTYEFRLSPREASLVKKLASENKVFARLARCESQPNENVVLRLSRVEVASIRDHLMNLMDVIGFDSNYEPNEEGRTLEELIDRLLVR